MRRKRENDVQRERLTEVDEEVHSTPVSLSLFLSLSLPSHPQLWYIESGKVALPPPLSISALALRN